MRKLVLLVVLCACDKSVPLYTEFEEVNGGNSLNLLPQKSLNKNNNNTLQSSSGNNLGSSNNVEDGDVCVSEQLLVNGSYSLWKVVSEYKTEYKNDFNILNYTYLGNNTYHLRVLCDEGESSVVLVLDNGGGLLNYVMDSSSVCDFIVGEVYSMLNSDTVLVATADKYYYYVRNID